VEVMNMFILEEPEKYWEGFYPYGSNGDWKEYDDEE